MIIRFNTSRVIGTAIALTIAAGAAGAQSTGSTGTTAQDSTNRAQGQTQTNRVRKNVGGSTSGSAQVRKDAASTSGSMTTTTPSTSSSTMMSDSASMMRDTSAVPAAGSTSGSVSGSTSGSVSGSTMTDSASMSTSATSTTTTTTSTTTTTESAGEIPPMRSNLRFGNGLYLGVQGNANFPQNRINDFYEAGYGAGLQLGWDPQTSPIGLRLNTNWNRLNGRDLAVVNTGTTRVEADVQNADLYSAFADAKLRLPFGRFFGATSGLYVVGGGGVTYFRNYSDFTNVTGISTGPNAVRTFNAEDATQFALNGGGGLSWGIGNVSLFVEGRYVRVFTQGPRTDYVPVSIGLTFH